VDAGLTWQEKVMPHIVGLYGAIDPTNHDIVYTTAYGAVYCTSCGWENCQPQYESRGVKSSSSRCGGPADLVAGSVAGKGRKAMRRAGESPVLRMGHPCL
jgi:hypothetical protein